MNTRTVTAAAVAALLALLGLVVLAGGGAVATGLSARPTAPFSCLPPPAPTPSGTAGPTVRPSPSGTPNASGTPTPSGYPPPTGPRAVFAVGYLTRLHAPASPANLAFLAAWMTAESGPDAGSATLSAARYNPLDTTMAEPGSWPFNAAGVQNYPSLTLGYHRQCRHHASPPVRGAARRAPRRHRPDRRRPSVGRQPVEHRPARPPTPRRRRQPPGCTVPPAGGDVAAVIAFAQAQLGKPYRWAAAGPDAYDCSGLTMAAYATIGVQLPHNSGLQATYGTPVPTQAQLLPGDLVFFGTPIHHVGVYVGNGQMIDAPHTGAFVRYDPLWSDYSAAVRLVTPNPTTTPTPTP